MIVGSRELRSNAAIRISSRNWRARSDSADSGPPLLRYFVRCYNTKPEGSANNTGAFTSSREQNPAVLYAEPTRREKLLVNQTKSAKGKVRKVDGDVNAKSVWQYIRERCDAEPDRFHKTAIIDCTREYTYAQMFLEWERYARVFSALGMTEENHARVGIAGTISAEPLFAFYGLNMTGATVSMMSYPDFLPNGQWKTMLEKEHITDLLISDIMVSPETWPEIQKAKEMLGLRNVILLHSRLGGPCSGPAELAYNEFNYHMLRRRRDTVFMNDLLQKYKATEIVYGSGDPDHLAIITHTSGTTKGTRKPLPFKERSVNAVLTDFKTGFHAFVKEQDKSTQLRFAPSFDFSSFLCMCGIVNTSLGLGDCVVLTFFGFMHPKFIRAVDYYKISILFTSGFMMDNWIARQDIDHPDFSSVKMFSCGGSYMPPEKIRKYNAFIKEHGCAVRISRGYGMSETGGLQLYVPMDREDDILGFPEPKEGFRIQDEEDGKFYTIDDGVRTGVMYMMSDSLCENELDGEVLFEYTKIDGRDFICSNDLVRINPDGSLSYAGRADRFFTNNEGIRFEAGAVETRISAQRGIIHCAVVPVLDKRIHDTVPVLYVVPERQGNAAVEDVRMAIRTVFFTEGLIERSALPTQFVLVADIPCNANGKIDVYKITRDRLKGEAYNIEAVHEDGRIADIRAVAAGTLDSFTGGTLPEGMEGRSALGIYELFNARPSKRTPR